MDDQVGRQLGRAVAGIHPLRPWPEGFGYAYRAGRFWRSTWPEAFGAMMGTLLEDAARYDVELPAPAPALRELVRAAEASLAEVTVPALVHFDLWDGNVLVAPSGPMPDDGGRYLLTGIIDAERAFYGDPLFELASVGLTQVEDRLAYFRAGYAESGPPLPSGPMAQAREALYVIYLNLVMIIETVPRHFSAGESAERAAGCGRVINHQLARLATLLS